MHPYSPSSKAPTYLYSHLLPFPLPFFSSSPSTFYLFLTMVTVYSHSTQTPNLVSSSQLIYTIVVSILSFFSTSSSLFKSNPSFLLNNRKDFPPFGKCFSYSSPLFFRSSPKFVFSWSFFLSLHRSNPQTLIMCKCLYALTAPFSLCALSHYPFTSSSLRR